MVKAPVDTDFYSEWARGWIEQAANTGTEMTLAGFTVTKTFPKRGRTLWGPVRFWDVDATGNALTYEELAAQACYSFRNPDSVEKLHRRIAARKQRDDETIESLLVDMDAMRQVHS